MEDPSISDYLASAKAVFERLGFSVASNPVGGHSGYVHTFDLAAEMSGRRIYVSIRPAHPLPLLAEAVKALDVDGEVIVIAVGPLPECLRKPALLEGRRFKVLSVEKPSEVGERLEKLLA